MILWPGGRPTSETSCDREDGADQRIRLFSQSRHLCHDARGSMKAATIMGAMLVKMWIKAGLFKKASLRCAQKYPSKTFANVCKRFPTVSVSFARIHKWKTNGWSLSEYGIPPLTPEAPEEYCALPPEYGVCAVDTEEYEGVTALPRLVYGAARYAFAGPLAGVVWKDVELELALGVASSGIGGGGGRDDEREALLVLRVVLRRRWWRGVRWIRGCRISRGWVCGGGRSRGHGLRKDGRCRRGCASNSVGRKVFDAHVPRGETSVPHGSTKRASATWREHGGRQGDPRWLRARRSGRRCTPRGEPLRYFIG
ncbi:hypothetical protein C8J57DRAFT_1469792 [Mycena rebaudengoi]|nr:hypothetical protein C8J57DRAFT_1469792 [Mycena rebaudengoi]